MMCAKSGNAIEINHKRPTLRFKSGLGVPRATGSFVPEGACTTEGISTAGAGSDTCNHYNS